MTELKNLDQTTSSSEINFNQLFLRIWTNRKRFAIIAGSFTFIGIIYAFLLATTLYKSQITLYPTGQDAEGTSKLQVIAAQFGFGGMTGGNNYNIPDFVKSRRLRKQILARTWLTKRYNRPVYLPDFWGISEEDSLVRQELAMEKLSEQIGVSSDDDTGLITVFVLSEEPQLAADIVNFIGKTIANYIRTEQHIYSRKNRLFIEKRVNETKAELNAAETALKNFRERNRVITDNPELQLEGERLQRNIMIKQEIYLTLEQQRELALIEETKDTPLISILDTGERPYKKAKPRRILIVFMYLLIGSLIGTMSCFVDLKKIRDFFLESTN